MSDDRDSRANAIIVGGTTAAMAAAVVPIPVADVVAITTAQIAMLTALTAVYGIKLDARVLTSLILVYGGAHAGMWFGSLVKTIPFVGTIAGGALEMAIAGVGGSSLDPVHLAEVGDFNPDPDVSVDGFDYFDWSDVHAFLAHLLGTG